MKPILIALTVSLSLALRATGAEITNHLAHGHADVGIGYEEGALNLQVHAHDPEPGAEYEPGVVWLVVGPHARQLVGTNAAYSFLGAPGSPVWILPQFHSHEEEQEHAHEELLFLGLGAEEIATNIFVGDQLKLRLVSVAGPGQFSLFTADEFGALTVHLNSGDGVSSNDTVTVPAGSHGHFNWAFTAPGEYVVTFEAAGTLLGGNSNLTTGPVTYHFQVLDPATTPPEEAHLRLTPHTGGQLLLFLEELDTRTFILESSTNLRDWQPFSTNTVQNGIIELPVNAAQRPGAFFRARWQSR